MFYILHTHTHTLLTLSLFLSFNAVSYKISLSLSLPQHKCMNFMIFYIFFCSYRAGVTMSLLYIDSVFLLSICACGQHNRAKIFLPTAKKFPARSFRNFIHKAHSYELFFFSFFLLHYVVPPKARKNFCSWSNNNNNNKNSSLRTILHSHYYSFISYYDYCIFHK